MQNQKKPHLTSEDTALYLKYLNGDTLTRTENIKISEVQDHLADCERCMEKVQKVFSERSGIAKRSHSGFQSDTLIKMHHLTDILLKIKETKTARSDRKIIDRLLSLTPSFVQKGLLVELVDPSSNNIKSSTLLPDQAASPFIYETLKRKTRGDESPFKIENRLKVITSEKIAHRTEVRLNCEAKTLCVFLKKIGGEYLPRIALLNLEEVEPAAENLHLKTPVYNGEKGQFECCFTDLKYGKYFLFIEPDFFV